MYKGTIKPLTYQDQIGFVLEIQKDLNIICYINAIIYMDAKSF